MSFDHTDMLPQCGSVLMYNSKPLNPPKVRFVNITLKCNLLYVILPQCFIYLKQYICYDMLPPGVQLIATFYIL